MVYFKLSCSTIEIILYFGEIIMFLEEYPKQTKTPVFENEQYAKITHLSHSYNNPN